MSESVSAWPVQIQADLSVATLTPTGASSPIYLADVISQLLAGGGGTSNQEEILANPGLLLTGPSALGGQPGVLALGTNLSIVGGNTLTISGLLQTANNLSDLTNIVAARTALQLGNAATANFGNTTNTIADGGLLQTALTNASTALSTANSAVPLAQKGIASGVVPLNSNTLINMVYLMTNVSGGVPVLNSSSQLATSYLPTGASGVLLQDSSGNITSATIALNSSTITLGALATLANTANTTANNAIPLSQKGAASGVAPLGVGSKIAVSYLITNTNNGVLQLDASGNATSATVLSTSGTQTLGTIANNLIITTTTANSALSAATAASTLATNAIPLTQKGAASGVAPLNASSQILTSYLQTNVSGGLPILNSSIQLPLTYLPTNVSGGLPVLNSSLQLPTSYLQTNVSGGLPILNSSLQLGMSYLMTNVSGGLPILNSSIQLPITYLPTNVSGGLPVLNSSLQLPISYLLTNAANGLLLLDSSGTASSATVTSTGGGTQTLATIANNLSATIIIANAAIPSSQKGAASGVAPLNTSSKILTSYLQTNVASGVLGIDASGNITSATVLYSGGTQTLGTIATTAYAALSAAGLAIPLTQKGAASGVAPLNSSSQLATSYLQTNVSGGLPILNSSIQLPISYLATNVASGLLQLDSSGNVTSANVYTATYGTQSLATISGFANYAYLNVTSAIPLTQKGAASGVAPLNSSSQLATSYLQTNVANGVFGLDSSGNVTSANVYTATYGTQTLATIATIANSAYNSTTAAIPLTQKGAASGVTPLNSSTQIAMSYLQTNVLGGLPILNSAIQLPLTYLPTNVASGLLQLDSSGNVTSATVLSSSGTQTLATIANNLITTTATANAANTVAGAAIPSSQKGAASGVVPLNSSSTINMGYLQTNVSGGLPILNSSIQLPISYLPTNTANGLLQIDSFGNVSNATVLSTSGTQTLATIANNLIITTTTANNAIPLLTNVAAIATYTGNSSALRTAGYYTAADGGGAFYTQTVTGAPVGGITDGNGHLWYLSDVFNNKINPRHFGAIEGTDLYVALTAADTFATSNNKTLELPSPKSGSSWVLNTPVTLHCTNIRFEAAAQIGAGGTVVYFSPTMTQFQGTISGNTLTLTSNVTGNSNSSIALAIGMALYSSSLGTLVATITGGSGQVTGSTWKLSQSYSISTPKSFTAAADLTSAITIASNGMLAENICVSGPDPVSSAANVLSSGWIIATASFQGTITGNQLTVTAGSTTGLAVGNQISGANLLYTNPTTGVITSVLPTVTLITGSGVGAVITLNTSAINTISTAQTFTACNLPNYNAVASGCVGIQAQGSGVLRNCSTYTNFKAGILGNNSQGHVRYIDCNPGGLFGYYIKDNTYDYWWEGGGNSATLAGFLFGTSSPAGANNGGIAGNWVRHQFSLVTPYALLQLKDATFSGAAQGINGVFQGCSFENTTECVIQTLPQATSRVHFLNSTQQWENGSGNNMPNTVVPNPRVNLFSFGNINEFDATYNQSNSTTGAWAPDTFSGNSYAQYSIAGLPAPSAQNTIDLSHLGTPYNLTIANSWFARWLREYRSIDFARKGDFGVANAVLSSANCLQNPEKNTGGNALSGSGGNWSAGSGISSITVSAYLASDLSALTIPQSAAEVVGNNPTVIKIICTTGGGSAGFSSLPPAISNVGLNIPVWMRFWIVQTGTTGIQIGYNVKSTDSTSKYLYNTTANFGGQNVFQEVLGVDTTWADAGSTTGVISSFGFECNAPGTVYLIGVQVGVGELGSYSPYAGAFSPLPFGKPSYTVAALTTAFAGLYSIGAEAFASNGRNTGEGAGAGTGCPVFVKSISGVNTWCAVWSGVAVTA